jgi:hypothetical protein
MNNGRKHNELVAGNAILIPSWFGFAPQEAVVAGPSRRSREPGLWIVPITFPGDPDEYMHLMREDEEVELVA